MIEEREESSGAAEEKTRPAGPGETGTTRFGQTEGPDTDEPATGGMEKNSDAAQSPGGTGASSGGSGNATSSGLQPGGTIPGGGAGATVGSIGTGGGSNANQATGDADENMIDEDVR